MIDNYEDQILDVFSRNRDRESIPSHLREPHLQGNAADLLEPVYQEIEAMKEMYLPDLTGMHQKVCLSLEQLESRPTTKEEMDKLKVLNTFLGGLINFLQMPKGSITVADRDIMHRSVKALAKFIDKNWWKNAVSLEEEVYQKVKAMKELYLPAVTLIYQKVCLTFQQDDSLAQTPKELLGKLKMLEFLERVIRFLQMPKGAIPVDYWHKMGCYENQIVTFLNDQGQQHLQPSGSHSQTH